MNPLEDHDIMPIGKHAGKRMDQVPREWYAAFVAWVPITRGDNRLVHEYANKLLGLSDNVRDGE